MQTTTIRLEDDLHMAIRRQALERGQSMNEWLVGAAKEKMERGANLVKDEAQEIDKTPWQVVEAREVAAKIRASSEWDFDLLAELCKLADLEDEWRAADQYTFEGVAERAAEILGVELHNE